MSHKNRNRPEPGNQAPAVEPQAPASAADSQTIPIELLGGGGTGDKQEEGPAPVAVAEQPTGDSASILEALGLTGTAVKPQEAPAPPARPPAQAQGWPTARSLAIAVKRAIKVDWHGKRYGFTRMKDAQKFIEGHEGAELRIIDVDEFGHPIQEDSPRHRLV